MNKGGVGGGGPTAAAAAAAAQKQKALQQRVDNDIGNIVDNFSFIVNVARDISLGRNCHLGPAFSNQIRLDALTELLSQP